MSEAEDLEAEPTEPQEAQEQTETEEQDQSPTAEEVAAKGGWKPKDDFIAAGGKEDEWRSAEIFNAKGEWVSLEDRKQQEQRINERMNNMEVEFHTRLENANKIHLAQLDLQKAELVRRRDEAIELADKNVANKYQGDIDAINAQAIQSAPQSNDNIIIERFNRANPWLKTSDPKAAYAKQQFNIYNTQGMSAQQSIDAMQVDISRAFPDINPNRDIQPMIEKGSKPGSKRAKAKLSMSDLTYEEKKIRQSLPGGWKDDAAFLRGVQDSRSENQ